MKKYDRELQFSSLTESDGSEVIAIFNYYIENSDAAFIENPVSPAFYDQMFTTPGSYPSAVIRDEQGSMIGFGMIRPYNPLPVFSHTAQITYFIRHDHTRTGIGRHMLRYLEEKGRLIGISNLLAHISAKNTGSIRFHLNNGFLECGRFTHAGRKRGEFFDSVWMQKKI